MGNYPIWLYGWDVVLGNFRLRTWGNQLAENMRRVNSWVTVMEKSKSRLADWKAKTMSFGRRLTIVKSVLLIMEYLVNISKRHAFWSLNEDILKINVLTTNTSMDDSNVTMEEYIRIKEEKARKCGKVFNWETTKYDKILYNEDIHGLRTVENEFQAIAFNDSDIW
ncbi:hypothetical protein Tco_1039258 [Tanacetum coccineum]